MRDRKLVLIGTAIALSAIIMSYGLTVKSVSSGEGSRRNAYGISVIEGTGSWTYFFNGGSRTQLSGSFYSIFPVYRDVSISVSSIDSFLATGLEEAAEDDYLDKRLWKSLDDNWSTALSNQERIRAGMDANTSSGLSDFSYRETMQRAYAEGGAQHAQTSSAGDVGHRDHRAYAEGEAQHAQTSSAGDVRLSDGVPWKDHVQNPRGTRMKDPWDVPRAPPPWASG